MEGCEETARQQPDIALEKLRLRIANAESMLDEVAALSPTVHRPVELTATPRDATSIPAAPLEFEEPPLASEAALSWLEEPEPPAVNAESTLGELGALSPTVHSPVPEPEPAAALTLQLHEAVPPTPAISPGPDAAGLDSPPRDRADFIRKSTPGGWKEKGLAGDDGAVMFNHERVGVHASDRALLPTGRPTVGSRWTCVSKAGVSARAQFAAAMGSGRQLSHLERTCIEESILHIYQPGDRITVRDVLVNDDPISIAEHRARRAAAPPAGGTDGDGGAENADDERLTYQVLTDRGWVNLVSRSGKVLFVVDLAGAGAAGDQGNAVAELDAFSTTNEYCAPAVLYACENDCGFQSSSFATTATHEASCTGPEEPAAVAGGRKDNSRRGCLCLSSSRSGPA